MRIPFDLAGRPADFHWNHVTGTAELTVAGETCELQSALDPRSQFSMSLSKTWHHEVDGHTVEIEKNRPLMFAGFRPNSFTVRVDDAVVAEETGK